MAKSILVLLLFVIGHTIYGQKVKTVYNEENQEVTIDGNYYITLKKTSGGNAGLSKNYSIQNKEGDELIFMKFEPREIYNRENGSNETSYWYRISFTETGSWHWKSNSILGMSINGAIKILTKNELIKGGNLNWDMAKRYLQNNQGQIVTPKAKGPSDSLVMVNVDDEILQEGTVIGKVIENHNDIDRVYHVYNNTGAKVMVAKVTKLDPFEWVLTNPKGESYNIIYEDDVDCVKILTHLASKGLLPQ